MRVVPDDTYQSASIPRQIYKRAFLTYVVIMKLWYTIMTTMYCN